MADKNPIATANATAIGAKLSSLRSTNGFGLSRKEARRLVRANDGVAMANRAPRSRADAVAELQHMLRLVPTTRRQPEERLGAGHRAPTFSLAGSGGVTASSEQLAGRTIAIRLTRAVRSGVI